MKKVITDKEVCMKENRRQAEENLSMEPEFLLKKNELAESYKICKSLEIEYTKLNSELGKLVL